MSWASSTWSLPSLERARCAKMSRISAVRSTTLIPSASEMLRSWLGDSRSSETKRLASLACAAWPISSIFPLPK